MREHGCEVHEDTCWETGGWMLVASVKRTPHDPLPLKRCSVSFAHMPSWDGYDSRIPGDEEDSKRLTHDLRTRGRLWNGDHMRNLGLALHAWGAAMLALGPENIARFQHRDLLEALSAAMANRDDDAAWTILRDLEAKGVKHPDMAGARWTLRLRRSQALATP